VVDMLREVENLASVRHPYIVTFMGIVMDERLGLVFEWCEKGSLATLLKTQEVIPE